MHGRVLVAGGTGFVGRALVHHLLDTGFGVRILSRTPERALKVAPPGSEIIFGDVTRPETLEEAFTGCRFLSISLSGQTDPGQFFRVEHDGVVNLVRAATTAGIERIVMVSGAGIDQDRKEYFVRAKYLGERVLLEQDIPAAIFRSSWFMESLFRLVAGPVAALPGLQPHPVHFIAIADLAAMIRRSFQLPTPAAGVFYAYGPESLMVSDALKRYCKSKTPICPVMPLPGWATGFVAQTLGGRARFIHDLIHFLGSVIEPDSPGENTLRIFGPNPTTLDSWIAAQVKAH